MANIRCKYCETKLDHDYNVIYTQDDTQESNCEQCEIMCRIAVDMISKGIHSISKTEHKEKPVSRLDALLAKRRFVIKKC